MIRKWATLLVCAIALPASAHAMCTAHQFKVTNASSKTLEVKSWEELSSLDPGESAQWDIAGHYKGDERSKAEERAVYFSEISWSGAQSIRCNAQAGENDAFKLDVTCNYHPYPNLGAGAYSEGKAPKDVASDGSADRNVSGFDPGLCEGCQVTDYFLNPKDCGTEVKITDDAISTKDKE